MNKSRDLDIPFTVHCTGATMQTNGFNDYAMSEDYQSIMQCVNSAFEYLQLNSGSCQERLMDLLPLQLEAPSDIRSVSVVAFDDGVDQRSSILLHSVQ